MRHPRLSRPTVLVAHGSPDPRHAAAVRELATATGTVAAFLEFDAPHPVTVFTALSDAGHRCADLVPLLLTDAYHGRVDVPRVAREAREATGADIRVRPTVGGTFLVPALRRTLPPCDAVVLAAAGSRDAGALRAVREVASALEAEAGVPVTAAFATAADPDVAAAVRALSGYGRVAVASYFIAPGRLHDQVVSRATAAGAVGVGPVLAGCPELAAAVTGGHSTPSAARLEGTISSAAVPIPNAHAVAAYQPSPA
ncbi:sirohydrochlorin ferrochelatase [Stackebrandtia albiflava]|uniref:Sirohydrochlorin ferrochelatase n=1 Tax=Stackebrandtia albiflava TaxID=406432 RepID=A0A562V5F2_9ACTN|nr:CbiX/SirB N-terminal domain-containing protein [Stackebrandtia albiflava]TWJ13038.1 sirohydrochlorin ferrochelatase [Stackebrandtia albiflava]